MKSFTPKNRRGSSGPRSGGRNARADFKGGERSK